MIMDRPANVCFGCSNEILDRFECSIMGSSWHMSCVKCSVCQKKLTERCYVKNQILYCKDDYFRLHSVECAGCRKLIKAGEFVRKVNAEKIYHVPCLLCYRCGRTMDTGDNVYIVNTETIDGQPVCHEDYLELLEIIQTYKRSKQTTLSGKPEYPLASQAVPILPHDVVVRTTSSQQSPHMDVSGVSGFHKATTHPSFVVNTGAELNPTYDEQSNLVLHFNTSESIGPSGPKHLNRSGDQSITHLPVGSTLPPTDNTRFLFSQQTVKGQPSTTD